MIRPVSFGFNEQTAESNAFQVVPSVKQLNVQEKALTEFDAFAEMLKQNGVDVTVVDDTINPHTPDSIFPNNWVSFHDDGTVYLYPMQAENRRAERRQDIPAMLQKTFRINTITDLSRFEQQNKFLEGTGSMVLDRDNKIAYACISPRTNVEVLNEFARLSGFGIISFTAADQHKKAIYHTNVMMCMGDRFCVVCLDAIPDPKEEQQVIQSLESTKKEIIEISPRQMNEFAGNMLQLKNQSGEALLVMSQRAWNALHPDQKSRLETFAKPVFAPLDVIETNGGGSARCMIAEIHLPMVEG